MTEQEIKEAIKYLKSQNRNFKIFEYEEDGIKANDTAIKALKIVQKIPELLDALEEYRVFEDNDSIDKQIICECIKIVKEKLGVVG